MVFVLQTSILVVHNISANVPSALDHNTGWFPSPLSVFCSQVPLPSASHKLSRSSVKASTPTPPPPLRTLSCTHRSSHSISTPSHKHRLRFSMRVAAGRSGLASPSYVLRGRRLGQVGRWGTYVVGVCGMRGRPGRVERRGKGVGEAYREEG
ncbi:hypothetical protein F5882DRAFT_390392 [Hyaloscypha sp. PMI_1271]|nr:hypothetical protein F5882DRAFT_390392 [Hyaloscypha sp. PMI_1271]